MSVFCILVDQSSFFLLAAVGHNTASNDEDGVLYCSWEGFNSRPPLQMIKMDSEFCKVGRALVISLIPAPPAK